MNTNKELCRICFPSGEVDAGIAETEMWEGLQLIHLTSKFSKPFLPADPYPSLSKAKGILPQEIELSSLPSSSNTPVWTCGFSSPQTIGVRSSISIVTPTGQPSMDSGMPSAKQSRPNGLGLPTEAKARKALPVYTYITEYFPDALLAEVSVSVAGNEQHNPGEPLHWSREKSADQMDCAFRHMMDHKKNPIDTDGQYHLAKAIWRLKAELQLTIEAAK